MKIDTELLISMAEANQNFSRVVRMVDENDVAVILKNNKPRYVVIDFNRYEQIQTELDKIAGIKPIPRRVIPSETVVMEDNTILEAVALGAELGKLSCSYLQRKLCIGFMKASMIIDKLEELGYITEQNGSKPRSITFNPEEVDEIIEKLKREGVNLL